MDIGSIFPMKRSQTAHTRLCNEPFVFNGYRSSYFSLCREAMLSVIRTATCKNMTALLPAYTCQTVIDPFVQEGWNCCYYPVDKELRIEAQAFLELLERCRPGMVVVHPYFGMELNDAELRLLQAAKDRGCLVMEDLTQCILSDKNLPQVDYYVGSLRKWLGIPDGAFLRLGEQEQDISEQFEEYTAFAQPQADAMYLRGLYFESGDIEIKEISRRLNKCAEDIGDGHLSLHRMSDLSKQIAAYADWENLKLRRMENFRYLHKNASKCQGLITPTCKDISALTTAPLYYPVYVENRGELQRKLAQKRIYAPVLWPVETKDVLVNETVVWIYEHILMLPCDQRYDITDIQRILDEICA